MLHYVAMLLLLPFYLHVYRRLFLFHDTETIIRMVKLVMESPSVEKYRVIQLDNAAFQSRVGRVRGGIELLVALGFEASDGLLILPSRGADELTVLGAH